MRFTDGWIYFFISLLIAGCASSRPATNRTTSSDYNAYNDDLSATRPSYAPATASPTTRPAAPPPTNPTTRPETRRPSKPMEAMHVNRQLDLVLDTIAATNRSVRYAPGFRIQVYVGNQRQQAESAKLLIYQNFPELSAYLTYNQPTYRLKVGDFMRRLDAERYYSSIRQLIPSAQLQSDKVEIRRSLLIK
ncbi:sporulation domain protein [Fibrisoma limi BUZ 3]|uniref:Sporulation domain protein n=2 Tax=Fibrisoma TaxID=861913 RepID=I2GRB1_9BACT|nr:SPOR domain-containing protein [Fibrisoma limi]CCH56439.1 sporulation domain protein [Fibrisoma limi BUZ 3]